MRPKWPQTAEGSGLEQKRKKRDPERHVYHELLFRLNFFLFCVILIVPWSVGRLQETHCIREYSTQTTYLQSGWGACVHGCVRPALVYVAVLSVWMLGFRLVQRFTTPPPPPATSPAPLAALFIGNSFIYLVRQELIAQADLALAT